jgi:ferric-dicitrate binding protein FerR (iron transport regulator)
MDELTPAELARLADYFAQELDPDEVTATEQWIDESPTRQQFVNDLRRSRLDFGTDTTAGALDLPARVDALSRSLAEMRDRERQSRGGARVLRTRGAHRFRGTRAVQWVMPYAFASIIIAVLGLVVGRYWQVSRLSAHQDIAPVVYTTAKGQRANIMLSDGSRVILSVDSRLEVPADYSRGDRTLHLTGEALFSVVHRSKSAFTVLSGGVPARVLGTRFVVRHYPDDTITTVAVRDGRVAVRSVVLAANQEVAVHDGGDARVRPARPSVFSFADGVLTIDDTVLPNAIAMLDRWYDADIRLGTPSLATQHISGKFATGSLADVTTILQLMGVRVVRDGRVLTLYAR